MLKNSLLVRLTAFALAMHVQPAVAETAAVVKGTVKDENGRPVKDVHVYVESGGHGGYNSQTPQAHTDVAGRFSIYVAKPSDAKDVVASPNSQLLSDDWSVLRLAPGETKSVELILCRSKVVSLSYCYQPNGGRSFKQLPVGAIKLEPPQFGLLFAKGVAHATTVSDDLRVGFYKHKLCFSNFHIGRKDNGYYDAGAVPLANVSEAAADGYDSNHAPVVVGHVYVVRTFDGKYAKFRVNSVTDAKGT